MTKNTNKYIVFSEFLRLENKIHAVQILYRNIT